MAKCTKRLSSKMKRQKEKEAEEKISKHFGRCLERLGDVPTETKKQKEKEGWEKEFEQEFIDDGIVVENSPFRIINFISSLLSSARAEAREEMRKDIHRTAEYERRKRKDKKTALSQTKTKVEPEI